MPTVKKRRVEVEAASMILTKAKEVRESDLFVAKPSGMTAAAVSAATYVVSDLKKAVSGRYDALREELIRRVKAKGETEIDYVNMKGKAVGYLDGWGVAFTIVVRPTDVEQLKEKAPSVVLKTIGEEKPCERCDGTGRVRETTVEVDVEELSRLIKSEKVRAEDVVKEEWRLNPIVPPETLKR
mgnify:CR=1 FL=1